MALRNFAFPLLFTALSISFAISGEAQMRRLSADDMPKVVRIGDPQISPDGKTVAGTQYDEQKKTHGQIHLWNVDTGKVIRTMEPLPNSTVCFAPDGKRAVTTAWDPSVCLWDVETGKKILSFDDVRAQCWCLATSRRIRMWPPT